MLEAIAACEEIAGRELRWEASETARIGDHRWWITDLSEFQSDYPDWSLTTDIGGILTDIFEANFERWDLAQTTL